MIIDLILDRKDGKPYVPKEFYDAVTGYGKIGWDIAGAMDSGTEEDVKAALCAYIVNQEYNTDICGYINSVNWLPCAYCEGTGIKPGYRKTEDNPIGVCPACDPLNQ